MTQPMWFVATHPDDLGILPMMLSEKDPRPAREQFDSAYRHGGGWSPFQGFTLDRETMAITYPGDPPHRPVGGAKLRDELIYVYDMSWVLILQPDGSWEIARMD